MRFDEQGNPKSDFVLHREPYTKSTILVTGDNFGCGSSREHAPWALLDFGIRCITTELFGYFFNNCFKNGILPISIPQAQLDELTAAAEEKREITIDLEQQKLFAAIVYILLILIHSANIA